MLVEALEGEMVRLRPIRASDADAMWELVTDPEGRRLTGATSERSRAEVEEWCATVAGAVGRVDLAVTAGGSDEFLGEIVLSPIDRVARSAELRLAMRPGFRGRGYGTESIQLMLRLAFETLGLHRVGLEVLASNTRAQALYENLGFAVEGRRRQAAHDGERFVDVIVMGLLAEEYGLTTD